MIITISKLVPGGQGLGKLDDGRVVFVWNALPGEEVEIEFLKKKKDYAEAVATKILNPSPDRVEPEEEHFLATSPWQILNPEKEAYWKKAIAVETYGKIGELILQGREPEIASPEQQYGYRNKMEFSFIERGLNAHTSPDGGSNGFERINSEEESISLAFFKRGSKHKFEVAGSKLCDPIINETSAHILEWINKHHMPNRGLKSLIVRTNNAGESIAALFIKDRLAFPEYPELKDGFVGFQLYYSTHKSPASVPTDLLYAEGQEYLIANILGTKLKFGVLSFFQINIPMFETALKDIAAFLDPKEPMLDLYSGVGAISLPLAMNRSETMLVEINQEAVKYANENIAMNNIHNATATCMPAEKITELITVSRTVIVDPPRVGLHQKVVSRLLAVRPKKIIYLSCDIATQARDIRLLSEVYRPVFIKLYNFFPRTPHVEGLVVLEKL